jgi:hypothetical protein
MSVYLIDTSVLTTAHRSYYGFDFCPGFWEAFSIAAQQGLIKSIDKVKGEIERGNDALSVWIGAGHLPSDFFLSSRDAAVMAVYGQIQVWASQHAVYSAPEKSKFADAANADPWLVAHAKATGSLLVSLEEKVADNCQKIKIPNVCEQFQVADPLNTFDLLRRLQVRLKT